MPISEYLAKKHLELAKGVAFSAPTMAMGMLLAVPAAGKQGWGASELEEVAYAGYARQPCTGAFWEAVVSGATNEMLSKEVLKFPNLASGTVKVKALGLFDGTILKAGNLLYYVESVFELTELITPAEAAVGAIKLTEK